jgi:nucleotide-binding universal stress UspA family protein
MIMKILIAYDKNIATSKVMDAALFRAKKLDASIYLVRTFSSDIDQMEIGPLESQLNELAEQVFTKNGIACETHILVRGLAPGEDIVSYAKEKQVDEIIIGIKNTSKVGKLVFGSTAQYVILNAHCPVLSVR